MTNFPIKNAGAAILAGGENRRMPVPKAFIEVDGQTIIEKSITLASSLFNEVHIVTNRPDHFSFLQTRMLGDIYDIRGPMTGILTALINTRHEWVFISACDMPFLSRELIEHMALARKNTHAVIPMLKNRAEPLFAFYSRKFISSMERSLLEGEKSLINFLLNHKKRVQYIPSGEVKLKDPEGRSFINLNTVEDATGNLSKKDLIKFKNTVSGRTQCLEQRN